MASSPAAPRAAIVYELAHHDSQFDLKGRIQYNPIDDTEFKSFARSDRLPERHHLVAFEPRHAPEHYGRNHQRKDPDVDFWARESRRLLGNNQVTPVDYPKCPGVDVAVSNPHHRLAQMPEEPEEPEEPKQPQEAIKTQVLDDWRHITGKRLQVHARGNDANISRGQHHRLDVGVFLGGLKDH